MSMGYDALNQAWSTVRPATHVQLNVTKPNVRWVVLANRSLSVLPSPKPDQKEADVAAMASNNRADFQGGEREKIGCCAEEIGSDTGTNRFNSVEESCDRTCGLTTTAS